MSLCLVTGGAGFIGSHLVDALLADGWECRVLDDLSTGRRANLALAADRIELIEGSICDPMAVRRAAEGVEVVFHQAALPSVPRSIKDPVATHEANATGTLNVLVAARDAGARRVVYASSSSVYGDSPTVPKYEAMPTAPRSPYAVSKLAGEQYCRVFHEAYGLETVCLRYFNVFGPRQALNSHYAAVVPRFIDALLGGGRPHIYGDGMQTRDFTFVANVVAANLLAAISPRAAGAVCNIACGDQTDLLTLLNLLGELTDEVPDPVFEPDRTGDVKDSLADISTARDLLGYEPATSLVDGLRQTVGWYAESALPAQPRLRPKAIPW